ncbi:MAG: hypothetical protein KF901_07275 [Myxococcales bacterium]|nr:hypothetical protein [Myxococcales bacterium]
MAALTSVSNVADLPSGTRARLVGRLRAVEPVRGLRGTPLVGYSVACSAFVARRGFLSRRVLTVFDRAYQVERWSDAILDDGASTVLLNLADSVVRVPAGDERTLHEPEAMTHALRALGIERADTPSQLQLLERSVADGAYVTVTGTVELVSDSKGAFRSSARPRVGLRGDRARPLIILHGGATG